MKVKAATHRGNCQVCGREQKLPGDRLSRHGYSVRFGFFLGTCPGTGHQPFEQSKDLIDGAVADALRQSADLDDQAMRLMQVAATPEGTCRVYREWLQCRHGEKSGYCWVQGRIEARPPQHGMRFVVIAKDGREYYVHAANYGDNELDVATHNNRQYALELQKRAAQLRSYADWQVDRIKDWKPQPLRPIE